MKIKDAVVINRYLLEEIISIIKSNGYDEIVNYQPLEPIIKDAYNAGCAYTIGSHELMKQTHKDIKCYLNDTEI